MTLPSRKHDVITNIGQEEIILPRTYCPMLNNVINYAAYVSVLLNLLPDFLVLQEHFPKGCEGVFVRISNYSLVLYLIPNI